MRQAAVLLPIIDRPSGPTLLLTVRPQTMADHAGQIALPGGKIDRTDEDALAAALREGEEEVGLDPNSISVFARSALYKSASGFDIHTFMASVPADFEPRPEKYEVDAIFEVPLDYALNTDNFTEVTFEVEGINRQILELKWCSYRIWGVTAGIIHYISKTISDGNAKET